MTKAITDEYRRFIPIAGKNGQFLYRGREKEPVHNGFVYDFESH